MPQLTNPPVDYFQMVGGVDTISASTALGQSKFRDAQNVNFFPINGFSWRKGYLRLETSSANGSPVTGIYQARFSSGSNVTLRVIGNRLESTSALSVGATTWTDRTNSTTLTAGKNNLWNFAMLNDTVVMANDTDTCLQVNSSLTASTLSGSPAFTSALFPIEFRGYMFYCNTVESATRQPDRLRFSDINNPASFTMLGSNNYIDVASKQGGDVRGAVNYDGRLYIFKRHGIFAIEYQPVSVNSSGTVFPFTEVANPVIDGVGTQSHRSICKFTTPITNTQESGRELVFFVDQFGVPRIFDGARSVQIGHPISKSRDTAITSLTDIDKTRIPQIFAVNYPERFQIHCWMTKDGGQHDTDWVLDYSVGFAWSRNVYADDFNCAAICEKSDGTFRMFFGDYNGKTYEYDQGQTDNGIAISSYAIPGDAFIQSPTLNSNWFALEIRGSTGSTSQNLNIAYYVDGEDNPSLTDAFSLALTQAQFDSAIFDQASFGREGLITKTKDINTDAKTLRLKFYNTTSGVTTFVEGFSLFGRPLGWKQS